jgi:hypothetical protein
MLKLYNFLEFFKMQFKYLKLPSNDSNFSIFPELLSKSSKNVLEILDFVWNIWQKFDIIDINLNRKIIFVWCYMN